MSPMTKPLPRIPRSPGGDPPEMPPAPRHRAIIISEANGFYITRDGTDARVVCLNKKCKTAIFHCNDNPLAIAAVEKAHRDERHWQ